MNFERNAAEYTKHEKWLSEEETFLTTIQKLWQQIDWNQGSIIGILVKVFVMAKMQKKIQQNISQLQKHKAGKAAKEENRKSLNRQKGKNEKTSRSLVQVV